MRLLSIVALMLVTLAHSAFAVEIKNIRTSVEGDTIEVHYDLLGKPGERNAKIRFAATLDGERYTPGTITVTGDYGNTVKIGLNKHISWNVLKDMPAGYTGSVTFELDAEKSNIDDPLNMFGNGKKQNMIIVSDNIITDKTNKLMWASNPLVYKPTTSLEMAVQLVANMNRSNYNGFSDWRIPNMDEFNKLSAILESRGYTIRQSTLPFLNKIGFALNREIYFWTIDKSATEYVGKEYFASATRSFTTSGTNNKTTHYSSPDKSGRVTRNTYGSSSGSGAANASIALKQRAADSGTYDVVFCTADGKFLKHNGDISAHVLVVRGNTAMNLYSYSKKVDISIMPK